ncbi:ABC transporter permease [Pseudoxanthomonas koreensis]|uniref:ABC transporter permease n=1 Tax=Pseudoxanthomonas koreensis TaxID=266061 RepID=UPI0035A672CE
MNALPAAPARTGAMTRFTWLLKREYWENRGGFVWAPAIAGIIVVVLNLILAVIGSIAARRSMGNSGFKLDGVPPEEFNRMLGAVGDAMLLSGVVLACVVLAFVVFFYALGALYDDRRDRSVLFWKSLPVSDLDMVLSKATWALVLAPLYALGVGLLIGVALWVISALTITINGLPAAAAVFTQSHPFRIIGGVLSTLPVYVAWALPTVGWLMFCSAAARSKPFLWAVLVPVLACVVISMMAILPGVRIAHDLVWYTGLYRGLLSILPGTWYLPLNGDVVDPAIHATSPGQLVDAIDLTRSWQIFATADLWIGVAVGVAFIALAVYLRRWRDEA